MTPETLQTLKEFSPILGSIIVIYWIVRLFLAHMERTDKRVDAMSQSFFEANKQTNTIIGNHIDHNTEALKELSSHNAKLSDTITHLDGAIMALIETQKK